MSKMFPVHKSYFDLLVFRNCKADLYFPICILLLGRTESVISCFSASLFSSTHVFVNQVTRTEGPKYDHHYWKKALYVTGCLIAKFYFCRSSVNKIKQVSILCRGNKEKYNFSFTHWIYIPSLNSMVLIILELLAVMSLKDYLWSPEPHLQVKDPDNSTKAMQPHFLAMEAAS